MYIYKFSLSTNADEANISEVWLLSTSRGQFIAD